MSCYHPQFAAMETVIDSDGVLKNRLNFNLKNKKLSNSDKISFEEYKKLIKPSGAVPVKIPCGKCIGCRLDKSKDWANRCTLELTEYEKNDCWFLTLTYDDEHLPFKTFQNGLITASSPTLDKRDTQLFLKRLRKRFGDGIRFFMCGEYGDKNGRPHYHLILFGLHLENLNVLTKSKGEVYYTSDEISKLWQNGLHCLTAVNWNTVAYVARYTMKKAVSSPLMSGNVRIDEFINMSRRPGIGFTYFEKHADEIYRRDCISKGFKSPISPPKYFDRKYAEQHLNEMLAIKESRRAFGEQLEKIKPATDLNEFDYAELCELNKMQTAKNRLVRNL